MRKQKASRCIRCICHCLQLFLASLPSCALASASDIIDIDESDIMLLNQPLAQHYFNHEIDFLAHHSMLLGNFHGISTDNATSSSNIDEEIRRLNFLATSLRMELDYMRRLTIMMDNPDETMYSHADESAGSQSYNDTKSESSSNKNTSWRETLARMISNTIRKATWPSWVKALPSEMKSASPIQERKHVVIDYDWVAANGFGRMYRSLNCHNHARDQEKPLYTTEMWRRLWDTFRKSTLFPFPIPDANERTDEPYYVAHSVGKGRGNFASRNITKGSLVHSGHPNTVFFLDAKSWFRFVVGLPKPMACDVMEWAWQQDLTNSGNVVMCLNMDKAVFFNDGEAKNNMEMKETTSLDFYVSRDVEKGEELYYDYGHFEFDTNEMNL
ncbi:hypothetical protein ACHAWU_001578 [Discostella pseudostelligera]|uniref:SET domain-containing protein n=1 Tax=Discostella pseudostelligera TaxID=259834 RepID=A0ABD3MIY4_9STRA